MMPKRSKTTSAEETKCAKQPKTDKQTPHKKLQPNQLYPFDYERAERFRERKKLDHEHELEEARKALEAQYSSQPASIVDTKIKEAFRLWCIQYTDKYFPSVGKISYFVPHFHIVIAALQESDLRGENAQRKVGRALMLLSNKMEENGQDTMFIMSNVNYENVLKQLEDKPIKLGGKLVKDVFNFNPVKCERKEADLIVLHNKKGVIFVQVKSYGTCLTDKNVGMKRRDDARKQLQNDEQNFKTLMKSEPKSEQVPQVRKVWAWPNLDAKQVEENCKIKDISDEQRPIMLSKDDLFEDSPEVAESEYTLEKIEKWWTRLDDRPISEKTMKVIIGTYIGTFSRPRETNFTTERSHVRTVCDSVALSTKLTKSLCLKKPSEDDKKTEDKRVHLQGPPGSGRTTKLILQAVTFLTGSDSSGSRQVIVVDTCRGNLKYKGSLGKPVCSQIVEAVKNYDRTGKFKNSVHHLPLNLRENITADKFQQKVQDVFGKTSNPQNTLFIIDEILPKEEWHGILDALLVKDFFKFSQVWCADGIVSQKLSSEFKPLELSGIHRIPPSVQKVLRFTDWDKNRVEKYISDAGEIPGTQILATNGPTPISIRHGHHNPRQPVTDCILCAEELARSLINMKMVGERAEVESGQAPSGSSQSSEFLPCSIAILFGLPENGYTNPAETETNYIETAESTVYRYMEKIKECDFIKRLKERVPAASITFLDPFEQKGQGLDELWDNIVVSWTDFFMGLERDVIIYLPGDLSQLPPHSYAGAPGPSHPTELEQKRTTRSKLDSQSPPGSGTEASTSSHVSVSGIPVRKPSRKIPLPDFRKESGLARCYWRKDDIDHYTDWDKTNVMCAASRCSGQLILLIP